MKKKNAKKKLPLNEKKKIDNNEKKI